MKYLTALTISFYRGQVYVGIKVAIFEASSGLRHSTELSKIISQSVSDKSILLLYSDGGPDHNLTFAANQLALICLFRQLDLDVLQAVRTAPYHSWKNPCERINCILNLGLQSVGLMHEKMTPDLEAIINRCSNMQEVRQAAKDNIAFKDAFQDSLEPVKVLLSSVFQRLKLKDEPIKCFRLASVSEMEALCSFILEIDGTLSQDERSKKVLSKKVKLQEFSDHCYHLRHVFGIRKCGDCKCSICKPPRLPPEVLASIHHLPDPLKDSNSEHHQPFNDLYGAMTTEQDRPSLQNVCKQTHGLPFSPSAQTCRNIAKVVLYSECLRPRVLYSQKKVSYGERTVVRRTLEQMLYSCGSKLDIEPVILGGDPSSAATVFTRVMVRLNLTCSNPVEVPYYSSECFEDICVHCACQTQCTIDGQFPIRNECIHDGKPPVSSEKGN